MIKKPSENYKAVSCVVVGLLFIAMVGLSLASLSHAFNVTNVTPEAGIVDTSAPQ